MNRTESLMAIRFGYGLPPAGSRNRTLLSPEAALADLTDRDPMVSRVPLPTSDSAIKSSIAVRDSRKARKLGAASKADYKVVQQQFRESKMRATAAVLARAVGANNALRERLLQFWTNHFTVIEKGVFSGGASEAFGEEALRPHLSGRFADMLKAVTLHPMMLNYLDQRISAGPKSVFARRRKRAGLNENLGRELLELHTIGVDADYSQADVLQAALLLTGLTWSREKGFVFQRNRAEPGAETVLGTSYGSDARAKLSDILAFLEDLAARPETAQHISRKLITHFCTDHPDSDHIDHVAAAWIDSDGDLMRVYSALLEHPATWQSFGHKIRQPIDFTVAALRALGVSAEEVVTMPPNRLRRLLLQPMAKMGQPWQRPRGPDGWPEEAEAWINAQALAARINWAMNMPTKLNRDLPDPSQMARSVLGKAANDNLIKWVGRAETQREGVGLVLASAAFNRR